MSSHSQFQKYSDLEYACRNFESISEQESRVFDGEENARKSRAAGSIRLTQFEPRLGLNELS